MKTLVVYACGGMGVNVGKLIEDQVKAKTAEGDNTKYANIVVNYIDTSEANTAFRGVKENLYLFEGMDGSGSMREKNIEVIAQSARDILLKHPPGDINMVIHSAGGGSGSTIGPMLASRLLADKKLVFCCTSQVGGMVTHLENTVDVLNNYEDIPKARRRFLPMLLCNNSVESESNVNNTIANAVQMLAILFSGSIERLDTADLDHWVNIDKITDHQPSVVLFDIVSDLKSIPKDSNVHSVISLVDNIDTKFEFGRAIEYQKVGIMSGGDNDEFKGKAIHFVLIDGPVQAAYAARKLELDEALRELAARKPRKTIGEGNSSTSKWFVD